MQTSTFLHAAARRLPPPPEQASPERPWALFLDLDGTLCPYRDDPFAVRLESTQRRMLCDLSARLDGALMIVSGRGHDDLARVVDGVPAAFAGDHGHDPHAPLDSEVVAQLDAAEQGMQALAANCPGTWVERKAASCALHYRRVPECETQLRAATRVAVDALPHLRLLEGNRVLEVTAHADNKGAAVRRAMRQPMFEGRLPVAVGDDVTDEDAFVAATALGGFGVSVGPRVSQAARYALADCGAVDAWLAAIASALPCEANDA